MKILSIVRWAAVNGAVACMVYFGAFAGVKWCERVALFVIWVTFAAAIIAYKSMFSCEKARAMLASKPRWFWWVDGAYDAALILTMAAVGWTWTALAWLVNTCVVQIAAQSAREAVAAEAKEAK